MQALDRKAIEEFANHPSFETLLPLVGTINALCWLGVHKHCIGCPISYSGWEAIHHSGICGTLQNGRMDCDRLEKWWMDNQGIITLRLTMFLAWIDAKSSEGEADLKET